MPVLWTRCMPRDSSCFSSPARIHWLARFVPQENRSYSSWLLGLSGVRASVHVIVGRSICCIKSSVFYFISADSLVLLSLLIILVDVLLHSFVTFNFLVLVIWDDRHPCSIILRVKTYRLLPIPHIHGCTSIVYSFTWCIQNH